MARRAHPTLWRTHNFLRRPDLVDQLLDRSRIGRHDVVYEIGAGTGTITDRLAARCHRVLAIEKDPSLCETLRRRFADRPSVDVRCADFLEHPLPRARYKVFANPPFDITTATVTKLVSAAVPPEDAFLAVQREAADRYLGRPSETLYALLLKPWFAPSIVHRFRRSDFTPAPGVDVVMLRLRKRGPPLVAAEHAQLYRDFVVACFTAWQPSVGAALARAIGAQPADAVMRAAHV
ncbi:MAG: rRNA adenine N(6)-methyltransferase family protein, partial [Chloroflexota bacterium]